jgi:putative ABC transport system substrate-binding protein
MEGAVKTRTHFVARRVVFALLLMWLAGCAGLSRGRQGDSATQFIVDPARRSGKPLVWIAMPDSAPFKAVRSTLVGELKKDFDIETHVIDARTSAQAFTESVEQSAPACVVLMDNPTIRLYRTYLEIRRGTGPPPPAIVAMASFLEEMRPQLRNAGGVAYEVQGVTAFVNLRSIIKRPVTRVGVVHRPAFRHFIERQQVLATKEEITLLPVEVSANPSASDIRNALRTLRTKANVDALWVLNDNRLLRSAEFLEAAWRPETEALGVPIVVGVPALVSLEARFGTLAVLPDLDALGVQTANLIFEAADIGWRLDELPVELPVSTLTVVNMRQVREKFGLRDGATRRIDKAIE